MRIFLIDPKHSTYAFLCPACLIEVSKENESLPEDDRMSQKGVLTNALHLIKTGPDGWTFDGNLESPTISPSVLTEAGTFELTSVCHSFVRNGQIQYLGDCTHSMPNQTVELPEINPELINALAKVNE